MSDRPALAPSAAGPVADDCAPDPSPLVTEKNALRLLPGGDETFHALLEAIEAATTRVWLECYIVLPDPAGQQVLDALTRAAERGCDVILLVDRFGSHKLRRSHVERLCDAGGCVYWFNPLLGLRANERKVTAFGMHRDHRKILVVDDGVAFFGGRNVSMAWGGPGPEEFFDVMVRAEGPVARDFAAVILETLTDTTDLERDLFDPVEGEGDATIQVLQLDLREKVGALDHALCDLAAEARERLLFCTPYFIPPKPILDELLQAAERGVDVRILTAGKCDVPWVMWAGRHLYARVLAAGARIYEHDRDYLHAKFYVADGQRAIIGSYNADRWGQRFNQEDAALVDSDGLAAGLADCFEKGISTEVTRAEVEGWAWYVVFFHWLMYALSHLLAPDASQTRREPPRHDPIVEEAARDPRGRPAEVVGDGAASDEEGVEATRVAPPAKARA